MDILHGGIVENRAIPLGSLDVINRHHIRTAAGGGAQPDDALETRDPTLNGRDAEKPPGLFDQEVVTAPRRVSPGCEPSGSNSIGNAHRRSSAHASTTLIASCLPFRSPTGRPSISAWKTWRPSSNQKT